MENTSQRKKRSMSVQEMGSILGLKKVEAYWLIKKGFFETKVVAGVYRVMIESFEEWYAAQFHYKKTDGSPPGAKYGEILSIKDIAKDLGISEGTARNIIKKESSIQTIIVNDSVRVRKNSYDNWYKNQLRYNKVAGEPAGENLTKTISPREMCDILGIKLRNTGYYLTGSGKFKTIMIDGQLRIDIESFEKWYKSQSHYMKVTNRKEIK